MLNKILIASGSRHTIPPIKNSPGVARIIYTLAKSFCNKEKDVKVISKYHPEVNNLNYNKDQFLYPTINKTKKIWLQLIEKLPFSYRYFKKKYGFTQIDRILYYTALVKLAKKQNPDIVVTFMHVELFKMLQKAIPQAKHVYFFRSTDLQFRLGKKNINFLMNHANGFLANTQAPLYELKTYGTIHFPMKTIYNSVPQVKFSNSEVDLINQRERKKYKIPLDAIILGFAGRFSKEKSLLELFNCVAELNKKNLRPIHIVIAGDIKNEKIPDHHYYNKLRNIEKKELVGKVHWLGWLSQEELYQIYTLIDYGLVLSKRSEGNSMFLLESMSYGKPIIATTIGGNKEVIENGKNGYLISASNLEKDLLKVLDTIQKQDNYGVLSANAKQYIQEHHTTERMVSKFQDFINNLMYNY